MDRIGSERLFRLTVVTRRPRMHTLRSTRETEPRSVKNVRAEFFLEN